MNSGGRPGGKHPALGWKNGAQGKQNRTIIATDGLRAQFPEADLPRRKAHLIYNGHATTAMLSLLPTLRALGMDQTTLVCTSRSAERLLREHFEPRGPLCVVPNGVRIPAGPGGKPEVVAELDDSRRDMDILYVGQLYRWKGIDGLVQAMAHLPGRSLTIVGGNDPADTERLSALARELGIASRLHFVGYVQPQAVSEYLARSVAVSPR